MLTESLNANKINEQKKKMLSKIVQPPSTVICLCIFYNNVIYATKIRKYISFCTKMKVVI